MNSYSRTRANRALLLLWSGVVCGLGFAAITSFQQGALVDSILLQIVVAVLLLPAAIAFLYLYVELFDLFGLRLLFLLPLLAVPIVFFSVIALAPIAYLCYATYAVLRTSGRSIAEKVVEP